jgi:hypothetical protein
VEPGTVLHAILQRRPDGTPQPITEPLIPLLDTTLLTNAPGEPRVGRQIEAEIHSADRIDLVMAFIRRTGEFVVTLVDEACAHAMNLTSASVPAGIDEIELAGLHTLPSTSVKPPRIAEAPVALECREWSTLEIGQNRIVIGLIDRVHTREGILDPKTLLVIPANFAPIGRMEVPAGYCRTTDRFNMPRPE